MKSRTEHKKKQLLMVMGLLGGLFGLALSYISVNCQQGSLHRPILPKSRIVVNPPGAEPNRQTIQIDAISLN
jgi:hypothetical protein